MKKIILIGTGNLGKRYIQAVINASGEFKLFCFDINKGSLSSVDSFLNDNNIEKGRIIRLSTFDEVLAEIDDECLVINAATAKGRYEALKEIILKKPAAVLIEKPVVQKIGQYEELLRLASENNVEAFVHYTLRFQPFCKKLKEMIGDETGFRYTVSLPRMGLVCVGIHQIDFFFWLSGKDEYEIINSNFYGVYEQKRKGFEDVLGEILLRTEDGGYGHFINSGVENIRAVTIMLNDRVISVFEDQRVMTVLNRNDRENIEIIPVKYDYTSGYMTRVIDNFLSGEINRSGELVSLQDAFPSHKVIFDYLKVHQIENLNIT